MADSTSGKAGGLGAKIKAKRLRSGWTQAELAARVGVHVETVSRWEREEREPSIAHAKELALRLGGSWRSYAPAVVRNGQL